MLPGDAWSHALPRQGFGRRFGEIARGCLAGAVHDLARRPGEILRGDPLQRARSARGVELHSFRGENVVGVVGSVRVYPAGSWSACCVWVS